LGTKGDPLERPPYLTNRQEVDKGAGPNSPGKGAAVAGLEGGGRRVGRGVSTDFLVEKKGGTTFTTPLGGKDVKVARQRKKRHVV